MRGLPFDVRLSLRSLLRHPRFAVAAVLTLALGIGSATIIFSILEAVLLRPWPYPGVERIVVPASVNLATGDRWSIAYADFQDWQEEKIFDGVAVYDTLDLDFNPGKEPVRLTTARVSPDFFRVLGVPQALGRDFHPEEFVPETERHIILGDPLWRSAFGGDDGILGRKVVLSGVPFTVVGVMPPGFAWPREATAWIPLRQKLPDPDLTRRDNFIFSGIARLRPDQPLAATRARLEVLAKRIEQDDPAARKGVSLTAVPLGEWIVGPAVSRALWLLLAAVGSVLLIGCVNVANLLLARGSARRHELAVLAALGAGKGRIVRQLMADSLLLAVAGGAAGILLAVWGLGSVAALGPADVPRLAEARFNAPVALFACLVSLLTALLTGIAPALQISSLQPGLAIDTGGRGGTGSRRGARLRDVLVAVELALSLVLLTGAGLMARSLSRLQRVDTGIDVMELETAHLTLSSARYATKEARWSFYESLIERLEATPGVRAAAASSAIPLGGGGFYLGRSFLAEGRPAPPAGPEVQAMWNVVTPGYFETTGMVIKKGRDFTARDEDGSTPVAIVNEAFARAMFPGEEALGKRAKSWRDENVPREIVGVVQDVRYFGAGDEIRPLFYVPHRQNTWGAMVVTVRAARPGAGSPGAAAPGAGTGEAPSLAASLRAAIATLDRDLPIGDVRTMSQTMTDSMARPRFNALLLSTFAALALVLAAVGLYGIVSYSVAQRTREIGVRIALGARTTDVHRLVLGRTLRLLAFGLLAGTAGALAVTRLMAGLLFEVAPWDPAAFAAGSVVLASVAIAAAWLPARRAARVDPMTALRSE
ncbi:MAG TPA: ABC transporter permease [Candidatus Polarisedimenticolia bacterium]|nr:ABC transporter permease [Candidatus Polarisedimenticolia bacterium]